MPKAAGIKACKYILIPMQALKMQAVSNRIILLLDIISLSKKVPH
jgi:hypothetical protein